MRKMFFLFAILICLPFVVRASELSDAIENAREHCDLVTILDITKDTANDAMVYSGIGTVAGGAALGTGIAKANINKQIKEKDTNPEELDIESQDVVVEEPDTIDDPIEETENTDNDIKFSEDFDTDKATRKAKTLGYAQGGTLFVSMLSNAASAGNSSAIATDKPLGWDIDACIGAIKELNNVKMAGRVTGTADETELQRADKITSACSQWETFDYSKITKRAKGAAILSGVAAGAGVVGAATAITGTASASWNDEQSLNRSDKIANVSSGVATAASGVATGFNAAQLKVINRGIKIAEECVAAFE